MITKVVTTPHRLSVVDVEKGVELLGALNVPTIALAENMAYVHAASTRFLVFVFVHCNLQCLTCFDLNLRHNVHFF